MRRSSLTYYLDAIKGIRVGKFKGRRIHTKTVFPLHLIDIIEMKLVFKNKFRYEELFGTYEKVYDNYLGRNVTPIVRPYTHVSTDGFWHFEYVDDSTQTTSLRDVNKKESMLTLIMDYGAYFTYMKV